MTSSSQDLHPEHGARIVATRLDGAPNRLAYRIEVYLPAGARLAAELSWPEGTAVLEPGWSDAWATSEVLKLARVLKRTGPARLTRWRGRDGSDDDSQGST